MNHITDSKSTDWVVVTQEEEVNQSATTAPFNPSTNKKPCTKPSIATNSQPLSTEFATGAYNDGQVYCYIPSH